MSSSDQEARLGIYWWIRDDVEAFSMPLSDVPLVAGFRDADLGHAEVWPQVVRRHPWLREREYFDVPRGRVLYLEEERLFRLFMPRRQARDGVIVERVKEAFALSGEQVQLAQDRHYEPPGPDLFAGSGRASRRRR